jgi:hypothetical protein
VTRTKVGEVMIVAPKRWGVVEDGWSIGDEVYSGKGMTVCLQSERG